MSKKRSGAPFIPPPVKAAASAGKADRSSEKKTTGTPSSRTVRETIESVVVAFILAFLFRTFEAEAFVIPTGSMAPTLQGRHKDLACPQCGHWYQVGASSEVEDDAALGEAGIIRREEYPQVVATTCPMCRYTLTDADRKPSYSGDRILVGKFCYEWPVEEWSEPERWSVIVFKFPGRAQMNYIKRLVGLPNETIRITQGDIFVGGDSGEFSIARKPPRKLGAMLQLVYDNDVVEELTKNNSPLITGRWPARWQPIAPEASGGWRSTDGGKSFSIDDAVPDVAWLRYRHIVPTYWDWQELERGPLPRDYPARPQLITDFYAYNTNVSRSQAERAGPAPEISALGLHWVGDLALECELDIGSAAGDVVLDLVEGGRHFRCHFDVASGTATLEIDDLPNYAPKAQTAVKGPGRHEVRFSNVDDELVLWVDGDVVQFDAETAYPPLGNNRPVATAGDPGDLAPVGIAARGASLAVDHLRVFRDIYYIASSSSPLVDNNVLIELRLAASNARSFGNPKRTETELFVELMSNPARWPAIFERSKELKFQIGENQFFVLGDNSPHSKDSRLWEGEQLAPFVSRELLIGKALFIYWPHSFNKIPGTEIPFPLFPNFERMGIIH